MKKIFLFILFFVLAKVSFSQYPVTQYIGADSTLVQSRGGFKGRLINTPFTDTTQANTQRISQYAGAMVFTTSNNGLWVRNSTATGWNLLASSGSSTNIYNSDGTITGTRVVELSTYPLSFVRNTYKQIAAEDNLTTLGSPNNIRRFTIYDDSVTLTGSDQSASSGDSVLVRTASGRIKTRAQSAIAGSTPTLQQVLATQSNTAIITTATQIDPSTGGLDLTFGDVGTNIWNDIVMTGDGVIGFEAKTITNSKLSGMFAQTDSIYLYPHLGQLNIDSLRSWSGISDTTYKKVMTWDTRNGRWEYSNWFGGSGGSAVTTIGTINSQTKSANGAVISGTSLVMQTADATYPGLMTSSDKLRLDSTSYLTIDKTFDSLAWGRNDSTFLVKSLRVQVNGSTITPTTTDSTVSYNLNSLTTSLTNGLTLSSGIGKLGGTLTETTIINGNSNDFELQSANGVSLQGTSVEVKNNLENYLLGIGSGGLGLYSQISADTIGSILLRNDTIFLRPFVGNLIIDTLKSAVGTKALRYNPTTGLVSYADTTSGGSGSGTVNSGTQYRLAYYATTGTAVSEASAITANRALISDANGVPTHSATTATELGYVSGVTSAIQTQLGTKWSISGNSVTAGVDFFGSTNNTTVRFYSNNTQRFILDSLGNIVQGATNTIHTNVKFHQRYSGTSGDYYWFADDPFNTLIHYMRGDGEAWHTGGISIAASKFTVNGSTGATSIKGAVTINDDGGDLDTRIEGDTEANLFFTDASTDRVGIGTNTPAAQFHTTSSVRLAGIGGAGAVQSDADGDLSVTSDGRLKFIDSELKFGLKEILQIEPVIYRWKHKPNGAQYAGFDALQVYDIMGELAAPTNKDGFHSLQDRALIGALINSVKEQQVMIEKLQKEVNKLKKR